MIHTQNIEVGWEMITIWIGDQKEQQVGIPRMSLLRKAILMWNLNS